MGIIGTDVEVEWAKDDRDADYIVGDSRGGTIETYEAWELADDDDVLVLDGRAPEDLANEVLRETHHEEVKWPHECERATVVDTRVEYDEMTAYYLEQPPRDSAESIGHREATRLLEHRGRDISMGALEEAWYFPERRDAGFVFSERDAAGESYDTFESVKNLTEEEVALVRGKDVDLDAAEDVRREKVAEAIKENSALYDREAEVVACWWDGEENLREIAEWVSADVTQQSIWQTQRNYLDKVRRVCWEVKHVWSHIPEDELPDEAKPVMRTVEAADPDDPEWLVEE